MRVRELPHRVTLAASLLAAATAGYLIGAATAPAAPVPERTIPVAAVPTSTPDLRTPLPTATLAPTLPPATTVPAPPAVAATATAAAPTPAPGVIVPGIPTPVPVPKRFPAVSAVVYVARAGQTPLAVPVTGAGAGSSSADRVYWRLRALPKAPAPSGSVNFAALSGASLIAVTVEGDGSVTLEYRLTGGTWGFWSQQDLRLLMQQIVFTATEEPGVDTVILKRFGGEVVPIRPDEVWTFQVAMSREDALGPK